MHDRLDHFNASFIALQYCAVPISKDGGIGSSDHRRVGMEEVSKARVSIYLDFVFIFLYARAIDLGCKVSTTFSTNEKLIVAGKFFSRVIWFAGSCDLIENFAMLFTLSDINELTTSMAFYFAIIKFTIVLIVLLLIFFALGVGLFKFTIKD